MAGRITFKQGRHSSRDGGWVKEFHLTDKNAETIASFIGRGLTNEERLRLGSLMQTTRGMRDAFVLCKSQDIRATLQAISKARGNDVMQAFEDCDESTLAELEAALHAMGETQPGDDHSPDKIRAAAMLALADLDNSDGGRAVKGYRLIFAGSVVQFWRDAMVLDERGISHQAWATDGSESPLVKLATYLLGLIGDYVTPSVIAKTLRKVIA